MCVTCGAASSSQTHIFIIIINVKPLSRYFILKFLFNIFIIENLLNKNSVLHRLYVNMYIDAPFMAVELPFFV